MPASLTCMANAVTASATANTPKSAGVSSLASTSPSANEPSLGAEGAQQAPRQPAACLAADLVDVLGARAARR